MPIKIACPEKYGLQPSRMLECAPETSATAAVIYLHAMFVVLLARGARQPSRRTGAVYHSLRKVFASCFSLTAFASPGLWRL